MKAKITITSLFVAFAVMAFGQTTIPGGDVNGAWTLSGSPYLIEGDITVPADCTLVIDPGVVIDFQGNYMTLIFGTILAQGTETDSIYFISSSPDGHRGLKFIDVPEETDSSIFTYCRFQDANCTGTWPYNCGGGMGIMDFDRVRIEHCLFIDNQAWNGAQAAGGAIAFGGFDGIIRYNSFIDNSAPFGGAIICWNYSNPTITHNYFYDNFATYEGGAIIIWGHCDPLVSNNVFTGNRANQYGGAISHYEFSNPEITYNLFTDNLAQLDGGAIEVNTSCAPLIQNNTMVFNQANSHGGAVDIYSNSCPLLINNILWGNQSPSGMQVYIWGQDCIPDFFNNDIQYGKDSIGGFHDLCEWKSNIDLDPLFVDVLAGNFHLDPLSPCIDAGKDTILDPDGTVSDIGAFYFDQTGLGINDQAYGHSLNIYCWPNPVVGEVFIGYKVQGTGFRECHVSIVDIQGRVIDEVQMDREMVRYNASHLPAGIYVVRMQAGEYAGSCKMVKK